MMMEKVAEAGLKEIAKSLDHNNSIESIGINIGRGLESVGVNISNSLIAGFSVLTVGILFSSFLSGLNNLHIEHTIQKYRKELKQQNNKINGQKNKHTISQLN